MGILSFWEFFLFAFFLAFFFRFLHSFLLQWFRAAGAATSAVESHGRVCELPCLQRREVQSSYVIVELKLVIGLRKGFMNRCECIARYCGPRDTEEVDRTYMKAMLDDPGFVVIQGRAGQLVAACILCEQNTRSVIVEGMTRSETTSNFVQRMHEEHRLKELSCSEHVDWIDDPSNHHVNWTYRESSKGQQTWYNRCIRYACTSTCLRFPYLNMGCRRKSAQVINYNPITTWDDHPHLARPVVIYSHGTSETAHKVPYHGLQGVAICLHMLGASFLTGPCSPH